MLNSKSKIKPIYNVSTEEPKTDPRGEVQIGYKIDVVKYKHQVDKYKRIFNGNSQE